MAEDNLLEREDIAVMLENWFQQRVTISNKALKLMLLPLTAVLISAVLFWFSYYIPVPPMVWMALMVVSLMVWIICFFSGLGLVKRVRTGDSIMLRKIRALKQPGEVDKS